MESATLPGMSCELCSLTCDQYGSAGDMPDCGFFQAVEQAADSIIVTNREGQIEYVNQAFELQTGYSKQEAQGTNARILKSGYHTPQFYRVLWESLLSGGVFRAEFVNRKKDGSIYVEEKTITPIHSGGEVTRFVSAGRDVTQQKQTEEEWGRFRAIQEATPDLVAIIDSDKRLVYVNRAGRRILGLPTNRPLPNDLSAARLGLRLGDDVVAALVENGSWTGETVITCSHARQLPVSLVLVAQSEKQGQLKFIAIIARDISSRMQLEMDLRHAAEHDVLTGMFNRRRLVQELSVVLTNPEHEGGAALLVLGLDDFRSVNDYLGHSAGDRALCDVAALLDLSKRENDFLARLEGDKFAIVLPGVDERLAVAEAQRMLQIMRDSASLIHGQHVRITASIGVALLPDHGSTIDDLMTNADAALYEAKERSRNSVYVYDPKSHHRALSRNRFDWRNHVVDALDRDLLQLYCQPLLNLHSNSIEKYEILLRVPGDDGDLTLPHDFLANAELSGLAQDVDRWVVRQAVRLIAKMGSGTIQVAVNLSPTSMASKGFLQFVRSELVTEGANPSALILEVTEAAAIRDMRAARSFVRVLQSVGCHFALDDFGTGFSSLALVRDLPVDYIKIDGSFVANLSRHRKNEHIIRAIVDLAHAFGRQTVAEFVDSRATARRLKELQVDFAQGFFIGEPAPVQQMILLSKEPTRMAA